MSGTATYGDQPWTHWKTASKTEKDKLLNDAPLNQVPAFLPCCEELERSNTSQVAEGQGGNVDAGDWRSGNDRTSRVQHINTTRDIRPVTRKKNTTTTNNLRRKFASYLYADGSPFGRPSTFTLHVRPPKMSLEMRVIEQATDLLRSRGGRHAGLPVWAVGDGTPCTNEWPVRPSASASICPPIRQSVHRSSVHPPVRQTAPHLLI